MLPPSRAAKYTMAKPTPPSTCSQIGPNIQRPYMFRKRWGPLTWRKPELRARYHSPCFRIGPIHRMFCCMKAGLPKAIRLAATLSARRPSVTGEARRLSMRVTLRRVAGNDKPPGSILPGGLAIGGGGRQACRSGGPGRTRGRGDAGCRHQFHEEVLEGFRPLDEPVERKVRLEHRLRVDIGATADGGGDGLVAIFLRGDDGDP